MDSTDSVMYTTNASAGTIATNSTADVTILTRVGNGRTGMSAMVLLTIHI